MVQGLAFLSKKSWHTKNMVNQEKVWLAEQQTAAEAQKTQELARQIQAEREQDEMAQIAGKRQTLDRGIDWMYNGQSKTHEVSKQDAAKQAEDYLLGKEYVPVNNNNNENKDMKQATTLEKIEMSNNNDNGKHAMVDTVAERNEAFRLRMEDPMYAVSEQGDWQDLCGCRYCSCQQR
jgi:N-terminal domain of CBF1 interacting co-repressor CIR/Pre-mRNA splicing factor